MLKRVEEADDMFAAGVIRLSLDDAVEELNLVDGCLRIVCGRSDDLEGNVLAVGVVAREPDGGEVTPAELADYCVFSVLELFANLDRVVAALAVVFGILLIGSVFVDVVGDGGRCGGSGHGGGQLMCSVCATKIRG